MLGVVLWSDQQDRKAVFWCEDHGDLAYYEAPEMTFDPSSFFDAGDMVQFDVAVEQRLRKALNPRMVQERACLGLPETLKRTAPQPSPPKQQKSAEIIAFKVKDSEPSESLAVMNG